MMPLQRAPGGTPFAPSPAAPKSSSGDSSSLSESDDSRSEYSSTDSSNESVDSGAEFSSSESSATLEPTLFQVADKEGLINEETLLEDEEVAVDAPPPRPPRIKTYPRDLEKAIAKEKERLNRLENLMRIKDDTKAVSLGTSKINYIDPRIVVSFAKKEGIPINKIYTASVVKKFPWAMEAENFDF